MLCSGDDPEPRRAEAPAFSQKPPRIFCHSIICKTPGSFSVHMICCVVGMTRNPGGRKRWPSAKSPQELTFSIARSASITNGLTKLKLQPLGNGFSFLYSLMFPEGGVWNVIIPFRRTPPWPYLPGGRNQPANTPDWQENQAKLLTPISTIRSTRLLHGHGI